MKKILKKTGVLILMAALLLTVMPFVFPAQSSAYGASRIRKSEAKKIALKNSGHKEESVSSLKCILKEDDDDAEYKVTFKCKGYTYEYDIDATSGRIEEKEYWIVKVSKSTSGTAISKNKAKKIAMKNAGYKSVKSLSIRKKNYRGAKVWQVSFKKDRHEYEYKIHMYNKKILQLEYEYDD